MSRIIFDIETAGRDFASLDEPTQQYLLKYAETKEEVREVKESLSFYPVTAEIVAIGMLNPDSQHGKVWFQSDRPDSFSSDDGGVEFISASEKEILEGFWESIAHSNQFITFNGRSFDCPFVLLRSAMLGLKPTRNLLPYRYSLSQHCDLLEQLTFYNAFRRFNLDFYCKAFGIHSPKADGITGLDLGPLFEAKRYRENRGVLYRRRESNSRIISEVA